MSVTRRFYSMKTALVILSYASANAMVARHWDYYLRSGCDIIGVGREDSDCRFPAERLVGTVKLGKDSYVSGDNLIRYHLDALDYVLHNNCTSIKYGRVILTEPDAIFLKPVPNTPACLSGTLCGGNSPGFLGSFFAHGPWIMDMMTAELVVRYGRRMLDRGLIEHGFPDRFYGLITDLFHDIGFHDLRPLTYSKNLLDRPEYIRGARQCIEAGGFAVHGIKSKDQLDTVTKGLV